MTPSRLHLSFLRTTLAALTVASVACSVSESGTIACADDSNCPSDYPVCGSDKKCQAGAVAGGGVTVAIAGIVGKDPSKPLNGTIAVQVTARSDSGIAKVELTVGSAAPLVAAATEKGPLYTFTLDTKTLPEGPSSLVAKVTPGDTALAPVATPALTITVDNKAPTLTVTSPAPQAARAGVLVTVDVTSDEKLASVGGDVFLSGAADTKVGTLSVISGADTSFKLGYAVPPGAAAGTYKFTVTGQDEVGNASAPKTGQAAVYGPFSLTSIAVTSSGLAGSVPGGTLASPIAVTARLPVAVPLGSGAAVFSLQDAAGHSRTFAGSVTLTADATTTTLKITDSIADGDADGVATVKVAITDAAGNVSLASTALLIDTARPFLNGLAPALAAADTTTATVLFTGHASEAISAATFSITAGGSGGGTCTCDGGSCASSASTTPLVSCAVTVPVVAANTTVTIAVAMSDLVGNTSLASSNSNSASFLAVPLPAATTLSPSSVIITVGSSASLTATFTGGANGLARVTNDHDASVLDVTSGTPFSVSPSVNTSYSLIVTNQVGTVANPAPTATVTVNPPLTFAVTYVPTSGSPTPGAITSGTSTGTLRFAIPTLAGFTSATILDNGGNAVKNAVGGAVVGSPAIFAAAGGTLAGVQVPVTSANQIRTLTYTLRLTNAGSTSDSFASLQVIPQITLSGGTSLAPSAISGGSTAPLTLTVPLFSGATQTVSFKDGTGATLIKAAGGALTSEDLFTASGSTISVLPPTSLATDNSKVFTFTLLAANPANSASQTTVLTIYPLPVLASSTVTVTPPSITGGAAPTLQLALPALTSPASSASAVTLTVASGGAPVTVNKAAGGAVLVADLGTNITVNAPTTAIADNKTYTYTLTVANPAATPATTTASGTLAIIPKPVLSSASFAIAPAAISGGFAPTLSATLPSLTSAAASATSVTFAISGAGCGSGSVSKTNGGGGAVALADLGTLITFAAPTSTSVDNSTCTYTLTVSNSATTPGTAVASGTLNIVPTPGLASSTFTVAPVAITGGLAPLLSVTLPALATAAASAASVSFAISGTGCGSGLVSKTVGGAVGVADLGGTFNIAAPASAAADNKVCVYTLTVSNSATTAATAIATGSVQVVPAPVIGAATFTLAPATISGGLAPTLSTTLPSLISPAASATSVTFAISGAGCGSGSVSKTNGGGGPVALADLGTPITFASPSSIATDNRVCTYTLTVFNSATTPATAVATGTLTIVPIPVLSSATLTPSPAVITGATTPTISVTLPTRTSAAASVSTVTFTVDTGSGPVAQAKTGGGAVGSGDLGSPITFPAPTTAASDNKTITYTLTIANGATPPATATATGTISVVPQPVLAGATFTLVPAAITGALTPGLATTLPALTSLGAVTVTFAVSNCGSGNVSKTSGGGGAVVAADLGMAITFASPTTAAADNKTCTYTLTVSNAATSAATATATGTLAVVPTPVLSSATFTPGPASITGGTTPVISVTLPSRSSAAASVSTVTFTVNTGSGPVAQNKTNGGGGAVVAADLGTAITFNAPATAATDNKTITYTLRIANSATTPASAVATGTIAVLPQPVLSAASFTIAPGSIAAATTPGQSTTLPTVTSGAGSAASTTFAISNCGSGNVNNSGTGGPVVLADLGTLITFASPTTAASDNKTCTYTLTVSNGAASAGTAAATGTLNIVGPPVFAPGLSVTPNVMANATATPGLLQFPLPVLSQGTASSIALTVTPAGGATTAVTKTGSVALVSGDLGNTISVDPPAALIGDASRVFTYSLTATNSFGVVSAVNQTTLTSYPPLGNLAGNRIGATATLLPNGKVLIVGGGASISQGICTFDGTAANTSQTAEVYDPATGSLSAVPGTMAVKRCLHTAVLVGSKVYIMGGANDGTTPPSLANNKKIDVFLYNAGTANVFGAWQSTTLPVLQTARTGHSATLLGAASGSNSGKIIVAGGYPAIYDSATGTALDTAELFDPAGSSNNGLSALYAGANSSFAIGRGEHAAALAGKWLLIIGGYNPATTHYSPSVDAIDTTLLPAANNPIVATSGPTLAGFTPAGLPRIAHSAYALSTTSILVVGGASDGSGATSASMQKYTLDASTGLISGISATAGNLATGRARFQLLPAGPANKFLVIGGSSTISTTAASDTATNSIEVIDTTTMTVTSGGTLRSARQAPAAVNLALAGASNLGFLVAGGAAATGGAEVVIGP